MLASASFSLAAGTRITAPLRPIISLMATGFRGTSSWASAQQ
ncbi:hypothetical protein [Streptomyces sp. WM6372]|nr:hypothetical protein [Streptomyces sp. WM6372]